MAENQSAKKWFYSKLALRGISKNRKTYIPYILTSAGMVMMFYIVSFLSRNKEVGVMAGGGTLQDILSLGTGIVGFFALIFLFYTNSFLIKRRKTEFGLYNILGMGKWNLARILVWESLFILAIALVGGLLSGILFSKLSELVIAKLLKSEVNFNFRIEVPSIMAAVVLFVIIFFLILLNTLRQIYLSKPIELLKSDNLGEKPPKANWILALFGVLILGGAYYISVTIKDPISAIFMFFVAVIMVILGTYLLFIAGSVALCKIMQKNKSYYYKTNHFVSLSSMAYRMKRNGTGLASICILSTMVLVMISSTACLFIGAEDSLRSRYPHDIAVDTYSINPKYSAEIDDVIASVVKENALNQQGIIKYSYINFNVKASTNNHMVTKESEINTTFDFSTIRDMYIVPLSDYNQMMQADEALAANEVLVYQTREVFKGHSLKLDERELNVKKILTDFVGNGNASMQLTSALFVVVPDINAYSDFFNIDFGDGRSQITEHYYYGFDLNEEDDKQQVVMENLKEKFQLKQKDNEDFPIIRTESVATERSGFYALYGGLFSLGILLGLVFLSASVLMMYYKQISEGYEDQARFDIMMKVGMTKKEIKKSINSQVLAVFFLPLIAAAAHITFAFPIISKLLMLFNLFNTGLFIAVTVGSFIIFMLFYILVYVITSRAYYKIVSGMKD